MKAQTKFYAFVQINAGGFFKANLPGRVIVKAHDETSAENKFAKSKYAKIAGCFCGCGETKRYSFTAWECDTLNEAITAGKSFSFSRPTSYVILK